MRAEDAQKCSETCTATRDQVSQVVCFKILRNVPHHSALKCSFRNVKIYEPLLAQVKDIAAAILANGKILAKEDTAEGLNLKQNCELMAFGSSNSKITPLDWKRFKHYHLEDNIITSKDWYDALRFRT
jgi:hypothetical protein